MSDKAQTFEVRLLARRREVDGLQEVTVNAAHYIDGKRDKVYSVYQSCGEHGDAPAAALERVLAGTYWSPERGFHIGGAGGTGP